MKRTSAVYSSAGKLQTMTSSSFFLSNSQQFKWTNTSQLLILLSAKQNIIIDAMGYNFMLLLAGDVVAY